MSRVTFRIWDHLEERMKVCELGQLEIHPSCCDFTLMRSTALADRAGQEIFEGDIIEREGWDGDRDLAIVRYGEGTFDSGVYGYIGFYLEPVDKHRGKQWECEWQLRREDTTRVNLVIGNIYEHSGLANAHSKP